MSDFRPRRLMHELAADAVEFIVIGGIAAAAWGSLRETTDLDVLCADTDSNRERLAQSLTRLGARMSGSRKPPRPIEPALLKDWRTAVTMETRHGQLDLLFSARGITYDQIVNLAIATTIDGATILITDIDSLIEMKTLAGRPRDLEVVAELRALKDLGVSLNPPAEAGLAEPR